MRMRGCAIPVDRRLACWGDSLTAGSGTATNSQAYYPTVLGNLYSPFRPVFNGGVGAETSTQIKARFLVRGLAVRDVPSALWLGRNNFTDPTTVKADIAACVADHATVEFIVLGVLPSASDSAGNLATIAQLNADLAILYGSKYADVLAYLQANGDGSANDLADIAAGLTPRSLRSDAVHLNDAGYALVAAFVRTKFDALGY